MHKRNNGNRFKGCENIKNGVTMETVTLKLTKSESNTLFETSMDKEEIGVEIDLTDVKVYDVDKFREFLHQANLSNPKLRNTYSIENKLNKELYGDNWLEMCWEVEWDYSKLDKEAK